MRPKPDGRHLVVLDHAKNCVAHGLPTEPRDWSLEGAPDRGDTKKDKPVPWACIDCGALNAAQRRNCSECGADKPWTCKQCGTLNRSIVSHCHDCGHPRPQPRKILEFDAAPMREFTQDQYAHITRLSYGQLLRKRRTEAELQAYARSRGYKSGWVFYKLREQEERFGAAQGERRA